MDAGVWGKGICTTSTPCGFVSGYRSHKSKGMPTSAMSYKVRFTFRSDGFFGCSVRRLMDKKFLDRSLAALMIQFKKMKTTLLEVQCPMRIHWPYVKTTKAQNLQAEERSSTTCERRLRSTLQKLVVGQLHLSASLRFAAVVKAGGQGSAARRHGG